MADGSAIPASVERALDALHPFVDCVDNGLDWVSRRLESEPFDGRHGHLEAYRLVTSFIAADGEHTDNELLFWKGCFNDLVDPSDEFVYTDFRGATDFIEGDEWKYVPSPVLLIIASTETFSDDLELTVNYKDRALSLARAVCDLDYRLHPDEKFDLASFEQMLDVVVESAFSARVAGSPLTSDDLETQCLHRLRELRESATETPAAGPSAPTSDSTAAGPAARIQPGRHRVGVGVSPGIYTGSGGNYWARLDLDGNILANENPPHGVALVEIKESDGYFETRGGWTVYEPPISQTSSFRSGSYFVGLDIECGTYRNDGDGGSVVVCSDAGQRKILQIELLDGPFDLDLRVRGTVVTSNGCGTWTRIR